MAIIEKPSMSVGSQRQIVLFFCRSIAFLVCTGYGNAIKNIGEERDGIWGMGVWKSWIGNLFNGFFGKEEMRRTGQHTRRFRKDILERFL